MNNGSPVGAPTEHPWREWDFSVAELFQRAHDFSVFIFYLDEKCDDFHPVSGQIELWHIVHNLHNLIHVLLLAVLCFWPLQILLSSFGGVVGYPWSPCCALMLQLWVLFFPSDTAGKQTEAQRGVLLDQGHIRGKWQIQDLDPDQ